MSEEHYAEDDVILSCLVLPSPCAIRIDIDDEKVRLFIGQRDWEWNRGCPDVSACGTLFDPPLVDTEEGD
jgi:hypothetical protein